MALLTIIATERLDTRALITSVWKSIPFTAEAEDVQYNCVVGKPYQVVICTADTTTKKGKSYRRGDWFILPITP